VARSDRGQLRTAYRLLETGIGSGEAWLAGDRPLQADITVAVGWRFTQLVLADRIAPARLSGARPAFSARAESHEGIRRDAPGW